MCIKVIERLCLCLSHLFEISSMEYEMGAPW